MTVDMDAVRRANGVFYTAFAGADMTAMADVWADDGPVAVLHPGQPPVHGRERVLASWQEILGPHTVFDIVCLDPHIELYGDVAIVICQEVVNGHLLAASNTFVSTSDGWKLVLHQASPIAAALAPARSRGVH